MFSLVIMTEPYASHDASEIELQPPCGSQPLYVLDPTPETVRGPMLFLNRKRTGAFPKPGVQGIRELRLAAAAVRLCLVTTSM